ncbi:uncharacterized protein Nmlp_3442 [Natronomonas moolapensis 8.8.11]|uniref:DUF8135 domain-containing protein n=1 Tax=Natronomonas moolapensis (strain DSM 18674 / CECT 7526 / JCM 14361 / 8.8.11) TaxID=268739 RepID=M1XT37_NATM8|nr:hypothetical protein [Natronomonas moolapensis]CCQ37569.1 uncharacterized protein Nmlp_3442 [Natronomonas moolapensis 8.8.11]
MSEEPPDDSTDREPASDSDDHDDLEDPFAELADAESDVGIEDPFEELEAPGAGGAADRADVDPPDPDRDRSGEGASAAPAGEDPLAELDVPDAPPEEDVFDADVFEEDVFEEDVFDADVFEEMETADLDEEAVWEAVFEESGGDTGPEAETEEGADAVVRKEQYCKKCKHFSEPPELACNNPDTEIVEVVGVDEFRVRNCPVVADRRRADTVFPDEG